VQEGKGIDDIGVYTKAKGPAAGGGVVAKTNIIPRTPPEYNFCAVFDLFLLLNFLCSGAAPGRFYPVPAAVCTTNPDCFLIK
jgi:hypothetical protein